MYKYILLLNLISPNGQMVVNAHVIYSPGLTICEIQAKLYTPAKFELVHSFCQPKRD